MQASQEPAGQQRFAQWLEYVRQTMRLLEAGASIPAGPAELAGELPAPATTRGQPATILLASPHPDDEALVGALPLRWRLETGARVVNCAITLGSRREERARRACELRRACRMLGFDLVVPEEEGFDDVTLRNRQQAPGEWAAKAAALREIIRREKPDAVFAPHAEDFHPTHIGTHYLVIDALGEYLEASGAPPLLLLETEFWHELAAPNLMVGVPPEVVALEVMAAAEHGGEVARNPYHLRLPARLIDNVRRGSEVVGGPGAPAQPFAFAELYRVCFLQGRRRIEARPGGRMLGLNQEINVPWLLAEFWPE